MTTGEHKFKVRNIAATYTKLLLHGALSFLELGGTWVIV